MSYSEGMAWFLIAFLIVAGLYLLHDALTAAGRVDEWEDDYQWDLRRKIARNGQRTRWGGK